MIGAGVTLLLWSAAALVVDQPRRPTPWRAAVLVICTSLLIVLAPPRGSFSTLARYRPPAQLNALAAGFALPPEQRDLVDWVRLLRGAPQPRLFRGEPIRVEGFVLVTATGERHLAQLVVRCCLADATPVRLAVQWPADGPPPEAGPVGPCGRGNGVAGDTRRAAARGDRPGGHRHCQAPATLPHLNAPCRRPPVQSGQGSGATDGTHIRSCTR